MPTHPRGAATPSIHETNGSPCAAPRPIARLAAGERVVICGAGPAGLTAAYLLAKQGVTVTVLEGSDAVGGISQTASYKGYRFDIGGHRFFTKLEPVQALWEELLGNELLDVPRLSRIHYGGKFFHYPLRAWNALAGMGPWNAARVLVSYIYARVHPHAAEDNFEQWVSNRFGRRLYEIFFRTYTEKVWGIPCTEIRAEWAAQRIQGLSLVRALLSATPLTRRSSAIRTLIDTFKYPRLGPGQMWERCRDRVRAMGGEVLLEHRVTGFECRDGRVVAVHAETPAGPHRFPAEHVISSVSLQAAVRAFGATAPAAVHEAAGGLSYRALVVAALILEREKLFPDNWIYVHTPGVRVGRIQNFNNWSASLAPEPGRTCLGLEYFCTEGDDLWRSDDAELIALATRELAQLGLADARWVVDGAVVRMPAAYPVYDARYRERLEVVRSFLDPIPNFHTVGRNGMHKYNNQDHSMFTAMLTVENLHGASHDVWAVNTDFEYHEEQRAPRPAVGAPRRTRTRDAQVPLVVVPGDAVAITRGAAGVPRPDPSPPRPVVGALPDERTGTGA